MRDALSVDSANRATFIGELPDVKDPTIVEGVRRMSTFSGLLPITSEFAEQLHATRHRLIVVRDSRYDETVDPLFAGPVISAQETRAGIAFTAADGFWRLTKRLVGQNWYALNWGLPLGYGVPIGKDRMIQTLIQEVNESNFYNGVSGIFSGVAPPLDSAMPLAGVGSGSAGPFVWVPCADAIQQVAAALDAPEWIVRPTDPKLYVPAAADRRMYIDIATGLPVPAVIDPGIELGRMVLGMPIGGALRPAAGFQIGGSAPNASDYVRLTSADGVMDHGVHLPTTSDGAAVVFDSDAGWRDTTYDVPYDDIVTSDVTDYAMRQKIVQEHIAVRKTPRETITFDPLRDLAGAGVPSYMTRSSGGVTADYYLGDIVPFRIVRAGATIRDVMLRVYGATRVLTEGGVEIVSPMLVPQ